MNDDDIDMEAYEKFVKEAPLYPIEECFRMIENVENSIIGLYESIDHFLFQDIDYSCVASNMPQWIINAGISPESNYTKEKYEQLKISGTHPIFGRFIYHYDIWSKIAAIQDRLSAVNMFMRQLYEIVPCKTQYKDSEYTSAIRHSGERDTEAHMLLNSIFVAYASVFDLITKVAIEQHEFNKYDFGKYKKMRSAGAIYNKNLKNIDPSLKSEDMLFSEPPVIRKIETFRNEFVHNGPWDLRCWVYDTSVNGEPADVIIYSPDMDENGNFISSGSRNKFYSQANRINIQLPDIIKEATSIVDNTINQLSALYQKATNRNVDEEYTNECIKAIAEYYKALYDDLPKHSC